MSAALRQEVLLLNRSCIACSIITLRRAITLLYKEFAYVIDTKYQRFTWEEWCEIKPDDNEEFISTPSKQIKIPKVILLHDYDKMPMHKIKFGKKSLYNRDSDCQYCGKDLSLNQITIDHVIPKSMGGKSSWENCVVACVKCNSKKANMTLEQAKMKFHKPGFKPFKPKFKSIKARLPEWEYFL